MNANQEVKATPVSVGDPAMDGFYIVLEFGSDVRWNNNTRQQLSLDTARAVHSLLDNILTCYDAGKKVAK